MTDVSIENRSTPIRTPGQLIVVVLLAFIVPIALILMLVQLITGGIHVDKDNATMSPEAVAQRLKPVGESLPGDAALPSAPVAVTAAAPSGPAARTAPPAGKVDGANVYQSACAACHGAGLLDAPKPGDKAAWKPRIAQGVTTLHEHAIKGIRTMPAKGGNAALSDAEVSAAVDYMVGQSK
jgi:cytochrome c5